MIYRKAVHDKLITDFGNLTYDGGSTKLFTQVKKFFYEIPDTTPACRITPQAQSVRIDGNTTDVRQMSFQADVMEMIEQSGMQTEAETKIDRLSNIEDSVIKYLEIIPNSLEHAISGMHIIALDINSIIYSYEPSERGLAIYLSFQFTINIILTPQLL